MSWGLNYTESLPYFKITCPITTDKACDGNDGELKAGARMYIYDNRYALTRGEWYFDQVSDTTPGTVPLTTSPPHHLTTLPPYHLTTSNSWPAPPSK